MGAFLRRSSLVFLLAAMGCDPTGEKALEAILTADADADGFTIQDGDCNDTLPEVYPDATEICDGLDNDCDTRTDEGTEHLWYLDVDDDGYGNPATEVDACTQPEGYIPTGGDCDDNHPEVAPGAPERCDEVDEDCDGAVDEDVESSWYIDVDEDGYGDPEGAWSGCDAPAGYVTNDFDCNDDDERMNSLADDICDNVDNDCDGDLDEDPDVPHFMDSDGDGWGDPLDVLMACEAQTGRVPDDTDCDDTLPGVFPGAAEYCNDIDDDCDLAIDEGEAQDALRWNLDDDGDGYGGPSEVKACSAPTGFVGNADDCDDTDTAIHPTADEYCNEVDDDCDNAVDESGALDETTWYVDFDNDQYGDVDFPLDACDQPAGYVADATDCDDSRDDVNPGETEVCDSRDNNCDGYQDEAGSIGESTWYADVDGDSYGDASDTTTSCDQPGDYVENDDDCDDSNASVSPDATEVCDSADNDCDGTVDENDAADATTWYADSDNDSFGDKSTSLVACDQPSGYVSDKTDCDDGDGTINPSAADTWYDGIDSDCAGDNDYDADADGWDSDGYGGDDCDDTNADINPDAEEVCDDLVDDDCSGVADDGCAEEHCGALASSETWAAGDHLVTCDVTVDNNYVLSIDPGAKIAMDSGTSVKVGTLGSGEIYAIGSSLDPVVFTSHQSPPSAGDWDGVYIGSGTTGNTDLQYVTFEYGGAGNACLDIDASVNLALTDIKAEYCQGSGIHQRGTPVTITNADLQYNGANGIYVKTGSGLSSFSGTVSNNTSYPVSIPASVADMLDVTSSTYSGNTVDYIALRADTINANLTLPVADVDYRVVGKLTVEDSVNYPVLTIDNVTVEMAGSTSIEVGTSTWGDIQILTATVTSAEPTPGNGDWGTISLGSHVSSSSITNSTIEYGGGGTTGGTIECDQAYGAITNSTIQYSATWGVYATTSGCLLNLSGNTYGNNTSGDVNF